MGFRTTVILFNDQAHQWENDTELGKKISTAMNFADRDNGRAELGYGRVVECTHADTQTLAVLDSYTMRSLAFSHWAPSQTDEQVSLRLLKEAADRLGYHLVKSK